MPYSEQGLAVPHISIWPVIVGSLIARTVLKGVLIQQERVSVGFRNAPSGIIQTVDSGSPATALKLQHGTAFFL